jgi:hypothetical protein
MARHLAKPQAAILAVLSFALCPSSFAHALDPELTTPYKVQVVLHVAPNRLLTPIFKEQLRRDLQRGLQGALGAMGEVEVIDLADVPPDKQEPLWKAVAARGLKAGLDGAGRGTSAVKTHFVNVDFADGQYEIQARQYDGLTGLASPAVRHERTPDRQFVARTAALLIDRDFGLVGTLLDGGDGKTVRVAFKGGGLKVPLDRWVKKGDIFGLVQVNSDGRSTRVPWTVLRAEAAPGEDGTCTCKLFPPQQRPLAGAGYRCLKLGTVRAPVRVRIIEGGRTGTPRAPESVVIFIGRDGFTRNDKDARVPDPDGFYSTEKEKDAALYDGVAFVTVSHAGQVRAQVPLPLVDDRTITIPIKLGADQPEWFINRRLWEGRMISDQIMLDYLFKSLNEDLAKPDSRKPSLERARKALDLLNQNLSVYTEEREELEKSKPAGSNITNGDRALADVKKGRDDLQAFVGRVDKILKEENSGDAQEVKATYEQAQNLERAGEYGRAITLYEQVLAKTKDAKLAERLPKLKAAWEPKNDAHRKARAFIFETWPKLESPAVMKKRVKEAQDALAVCRDAKDPFGPRRVLAVALLHAKQLTKQLKELSPDNNEQDREPAQELSDVLDPLAKLIEDAQKAVAQNPAP